jgi:hypothetical protein
MNKPKKSKRPMTDAQKRALAKGRAKRHEQMKNPGKKAESTEPADQKVSEPAKGQQGAKESKRSGPKHLSADPPRPKPGTPSTGRRLTPGTVVIPALDKLAEAAPAPEPEGAETEEMVAKREALYGSEQWQVVTGNKMDTTGTADACATRAIVARRRENLPDVHVLDPSGKRIDPEKEAEAARLARQARNWRVERHNGGLQKVMYKGKMDGAIKAYEREFERASGCTVVMFNGRGEPVDQVCKPQFRTTINGPDKEIEVDTETYKKFVRVGDDEPDPLRDFIVDRDVKPLNMPGAGRCDAQAPVQAEGCFVPVDMTTPDWSGCSDVTVPTAPAAPLRAKLGRDPDLVQLEDVGAALAHCRTLVAYLEHKEQAMRAKVVAKMLSGPPQAIVDSMAAIMRNVT